MKKIRICSPQLGVSPNSSLGGEIYDYQTLKGFTKKDIEVLVFLPKKRQFDPTLKNFKVTYAPIQHIFPPWVFSFLSLPYILNQYQRAKFDILRIHSPRFLGMAGLIFHLINPKVPILCSMVTVDDSKLSYPIEKLIFNVSKKIIVQSEYIKNRIIKKFNIDPDKIAITFGGQSEKFLGRQKDLSKLYGITDEDIILLFMGGVIKRKNPLFLLEIVKNLKSKFPKIKMIVIGQGEIKGKMINQVKNGQLDENFIFIDSAYGAEKDFWFRKMDIFLFPSLDEGFGLAVTEAMSYGKVIISSDRAAFTEIIENGKSGYTLPIEDSTVWNKTIIKVLTEAKLRKKIEKSAKERVSKFFNWERTYELNYQVVKEMIE